MRSWVRSTLCAMVLLAGPNAFGQDYPSERVRELVTQGQRHYGAGRFDAAIARYSEAYAAQPLPALLFNLGQCHRQLGELARARSFYRRYLDLSPDGKNAPVARELLSRLTRGPPTEDAPRRTHLLPADRSSARAAEDAVSAAPDQPPLYKRWWFWTGVGATVATVAAVAVIATLPPAQAQSPPGKRSFR